MRTTAELLNPAYSAYIQSNLEHYSLNFHSRIFKELKIQTQIEKNFSGLLYNVGSPSVHYTIISNEKQGKNEPFFDGTIGENEFNLVYLPKGTAYELIPTGEMLTFSIHFDALYLQPLAQLFPMLDDFFEKVKQDRPILLKPACSRASSTIQNDIKWLYYRLIESKDEDEFLSLLPLGGKVQQVILESLSVLDGRNTLAEYDSVAVKEATEYLSSKPGFSVARLAKLLDISEENLQEGFKILEGAAMSDFLEQAELRHAKVLLRDKNIPIEEIALSMGYSKAGFARMFKSKTGLTPHAFRKKKDTENDP